VVLFPNCKINLGLNIIRKRSDGYHDLETIFYPVAILDALELVQIDEAVKNIQSAIAVNIEGGSQFSITGEIIEGNPQDNLCVKAYQLLKKDFSQLPAIKMHLHKTIPTGAGLGGGSADGAFALKLFNKKFDLGISTKQLLDYARQLGSDCPFFIINEACFATGRGEILEPIQLDLSAYKFLIINPSIHISTDEAFSLLVPALPSKSVKEVVQQPVGTWRQELKNDFENVVFKDYPEVKSIKEKLYEAGAIYASMTGSGSTVYGLFEKNWDVNLKFPANYLIKNIPL
jgi:4-diphosphocytidyl-2-C-methyl-D-erythritol kinase